MISAAISEVLSYLPPTRGRLRTHADLSKGNWFGVGGLADILFKPEDTNDLAQFMQHLPRHVPVTVLGVGSNLLIRDGGMEGVVIRLGRGLAECRAEGNRLVVGAACLNSNAVTVARLHGIGGVEFLSGIPGTIGGALAMNAGAYGMETKNILVEAEAVDPHGGIHILTPEKIGYDYRHCALPQGWVFTRATLQGHAEKHEVIEERIAHISAERSLTQPVRSRTGGSTFKNPTYIKAWKLIEAAGCRGLEIGGAQMSPLHCNFMINTGGATAHDLETLGEEVRRRVYDNSGIRLEWEIKRLGRPMMHMAQKVVA